MKNLLTKSLTVLSVLVCSLPYNTPARADAWYPNCIREPMQLDANNAGNIEALDCRLTAVKAKLQGQDGTLHTYHFRDGINVKVFISNPNAALPHHPHPVRFTVGQSDWFPGQFLERDLPHNCGPCPCYWSTVRDAAGRVVVARGLILD